MGAEAHAIETGFATYCGRSHAVSVNTCTTALTIALMHFGARDREILVPAGCFVTDVSAVMFAGGRPVLVDMDPTTLSFDLVDLKRKITPQTRGLIWVHLTGIISEKHQALMSLARENNLFVIEDASHAHGAICVSGARAGSFGDASCFSFYPTKIITAGSGGMLLTNDDTLRDFARSMRLFGKDEATGELVRLGNDWFLDELRAAVCHVQLEDLDQQLTLRRRAAARYETMLGNLPNLATLRVAHGAQPSWYQYPIFLPNASVRERIQNGLKTRHGIESKPIYRPVNHEVVFRHLDRGDLQATNDTLGRSLCLPLFADITEVEQERVADAVRAERRLAT